MSTEESPATDVSRMPLKALGLRTGMALQTRRLVEGASKRESQFFGAIEGKGVMVGPMGPEGLSTELDDGEVCVVRGFTGQYEFSFLSKVLQTFQKPFAYALLAYPAQVDARKVRQSMRTKTSWPATVQVAAKGGLAASAAQQAVLVDISMHGAMVQTDTSLSTVGDMVHLCLTVTVDDEPMQLNLNASICHNNRSAAGLTFSPRVKVCEHCRKAYWPQRLDSKFCSDTCRQRAHRERIAVTQA